MGNGNRRYLTGSATVTVNYGYDIHSIECSGRTLRQILKGRAVTLRGQGFWWDGQPDQDYWTFNEVEPGSLYVHTEGGGVVFDGNLANGEVWANLDGKDIELEGLKPATKRGGNSAGTAGAA
jgi:hypothetical protein